MATLQIVGSREIFGQTVIAFGTIEHPLFLAKDVAEWIGHRDISSMLRSVDENEKVRIDGEILDPAQLAESGNLRTSRWYLTEDGLYEVLMLSRKPVAKEFKKGVKQMLHDVRMKNGESRVLSRNS